jgi:16S rRNA (uracil1498-N3)-methyltransferase
VISSVKQCGRAVVPPVLETRDFAEIVAASADQLTLMFVEPENTSGSVSELSALEGSRPARAMILIGPEGGWDPQEMEHAVTAGVKLVTFGKRTLRADAAGAAALAVLQYVWKDL